MKAGTCLTPELVALPRRIVKSKKIFLSRNGNKRISEAFGWQAGGVGGINMIEKLFSTIIYRAVVVEGGEWKGKHTTKTE